jgi:hypothetical protein
MSGTPGKKLVPTQVSLTSSFKAFGHIDGVSSGTEISISYSIPEGITNDELREEIVKRLCGLGVAVVTQEHNKGTLSKSLYEILVNKLKESTKRMLSNGSEETKTN